MKSIAPSIAGFSWRVLSRQKEIDLFLARAEAGVLYVNQRSGATTGAWPGYQSFCGWKGSGVDGKGGLGPYAIPRYMRGNKPGQSCIHNLRRMGLYKAGGSSLCCVAQSDGARGLIQLSESAGGTRPVP